MTLENIFKFVFYNGTAGGIIIANNLEEAMLKVEKYISDEYDYILRDEKKVVVWKLTDSINRTDDVYEIFNA